MSTVTHEIGHNLGLQHSFENDRDETANVCRVGTRIQQERTTRNIMDYQTGVTDDRCTFFLY
ncbi:MAG: M12 family metallo-peptidase, partial [Bacteroidales bacterium]|nr:M12 family metallo-peptidase [Bacteroidales bacterium]